MLYFLIWVVPAHGCLLHYYFNYIRKAILLIIFLNLKTFEFRLLSPGLLKCMLFRPSSLKCRFSFRRSKSGPEICMFNSFPW